MGISLHWPARLCPLCRSKAGTEHELLSPVLFQSPRRPHSNRALSVHQAPHLHGQPGTPHCWHNHDRWLSCAMSLRV